jgi:hypothetical protein
MFFRWFEGKKFRARITPQALKMLLVINYAILLSALLVILLTPPASGYEFSIYDAYPNYFWCLIITSIFLGQICAVLSVLDDSTGKYWPLGFLAAVIANCLLLFLPVIRGYFIYGSGDILTHIGYMKDIGNYASIGSNHYPILHMLGFSMHEFTGLSFGIITMIIPPIFSIVSIFYWYILGKEIFNDKFKAITLVLIAFLPMHGVTNSLFTPNHEAFLMLPLVLYCLIKFQNAADKREISAILITLSVLIVLFHPLIAIMVMSIYALQYASDIISKLALSSKPHAKNTWIVIAIMAIIFSVWSTYIHLLTNVLDPLISSIIGTDAVESELLANLNLVSQVEVDIFYLIKLGLFTYGLDAILGLLALISILYLLILYTKGEVRTSRFLLFSIVCFIAFFALGITIFFTINQFGYARVYKIARIFSLIVISSSVVTAYRRLQNISSFKKVIFCALTCTVIIVLIVLSAFTLHLSPNIKQINQQVPMSDYYGMAAFFEKRDDSILILEHGISQVRFHDAIYGCSYPKVNIRYNWGGDNSLLPVDHFGYNASSSLGSNYNGERYFLLATQGKNFYENMYPEFPDKWRFTDQDYEMLESDTSVIRVGSNENLALYLINYS